MQTRRANALSPLAIVLPHPHIPRRTSSILSLNSAASPRTPRSCGSPSNSIFVPPPPNRKSTDSWNSSNADDLEWEWKPDQVLLLSRTLDALPAHLVTPFNGPIPPSNLLDKIARGVSQAKGPVDWPHSLRATRVKLIELSRLRAKEQAAANKRRESIAEEPEDALDVHANYTYTQGGRDTTLGVAAGAKRPLYRQSSMDFILNTQETDIKNNEHLARLSSRLQRAERQAAHHPYHLSPPVDRCTSPPPLSAVPSLITPSTPSSSTLNTLSSSSLQRRDLRRRVSSLSSSSLSIISNSSDGVLPNPRVQRLMQDDGLAPVPPPKDTPTSTKFRAKRAPSFGALAQDARREHLAQSPDNGHTRQNSGSYPSSDEEEKIRNKQAKKAKKLSVATPPPDSPTPITPISSPMIDRRGVQKPKELTHRSSRSLKEGLAEIREGPKTFHTPVKTKPPTPTNLLPMNLQRNPSMFGPELPPLSNGTPLPLSPAPFISSRTLQQLRSPALSPANATRSAPRALTSVLGRPNHTPSPSPGSPIASIPRPVLAKAPCLSPPVGITASPNSATNTKLKTLRRVRRLAPARRISFSSIIPPPGSPSLGAHGTYDEADNDADGEGEGDDMDGGEGGRGNGRTGGGGKIELGSAFQLH